MAEVKSFDESDETRRKDHDSYFYIKGLPELEEDTIDLLANYSHWPSNEIVPLVQRLREKAWQIHHYPCIGLYRFAKLSFSRHPHYKSIVLPRLTDATSDDNILDIGTCFGQDVRKLIYDGVSPSRIYASDLHADFWKLGLELFRDQDRLPDGLFLYPADLFRSDSALEPVEHSISIVHANAIFHLFNYESQIKVAKQVVKLLRPKSGSLIIGQQSANVNAGDYERRLEDRDSTIFRHNSESWEKMWEQAGRELTSELGSGEIKFKVESELSLAELPKGVERPQGGQWANSGMSRMWFTVERL